MAKCSRCNKPLERIEYVEPDWDQLYGVGHPRPPLCYECWKKREIEESEKHILKEG